MKAILVDAYDSFVYIIHQYLLTLGVDTHVVRNDVVDAGQIRSWDPDFLVLGPGPGHPADAHYIELIHQFKGTPILGVCLGHQAIGLAFGGRVSGASQLMHGKTSQIQHDDKGCFAGQPNPFRAARYHSLIVEDAGFPDVLEVSARSEDDRHIMGLRHRELPIESIQFHPESVYTHEGIRLFRNFIQRHAEAAR